MVEKRRISKEIRYRSASNMLNVWDQLDFAHKMDEDRECCEEADAFILTFEDLLLRFIHEGKLLTTDVVQGLIDKHPMNTTAVRANEFSGLKGKREGLIGEAIRHFLYNCHLIEDIEYRENSPWVNDVTEWWFGRLGYFCTTDKHFWTAEFLDWTVKGTSFYFLLNYHVNEDLLKNYVVSWKLKPEEILQASIEYRTEEKVEAYLDYYRGTSDMEMADMAHRILQNEACMVYHDKLWHVTRLLADAKKYDELAGLYVGVDLPILQASMLSGVEEVDDLLGMTERLLGMQIPHPLTSFSLIREYLYELCARTSANLLSYEEEFYGRKLSAGLEKEWGEVKDAWWKTLPDYFNRGIGLLKSQLAPKELAGWAFAKQEIKTSRKNATSDGYNDCVKVLKNEALKVYRPDELPVTAGDLQYLLYIGGLYLHTDVKPSAEAFAELLVKMTETVNMNKMMPVSEIDNKFIGDCDIAAKVLCECFADWNDIFSWFDRNKTWYEGWNVLPLGKQYDSCHKECHLLCWMLMVASLDNVVEDVREKYWGRLMESLFGQIRAAGAYIKSDYTTVLVLAGMVAVQTYVSGVGLLMKKCCDYVIEIDNLITIMTNAGIMRLLAEQKILRDKLMPVCVDITRRFEIEWPLKQRRMMMVGRETRERAKAIENAVTEWKKMME